MQYNTKVHRKFLLEMLSRKCPVESPGVYLLMIFSFGQNRVDLVWDTEAHTHTHIKPPALHGVRSFRVPQVAPAGCYFGKEGFAVLKNAFLYRMALPELKKLFFFALRCSFQPPLTYCPQKIQPFFWCSLNSLRCKAGVSHRFKSLPAMPGTLQLSA